MVSAPDQRLPEETVITVTGTVVANPQAPGGAEIARRFAEFSAALPGILADLRLGRDEMTFSDYANIASTWLAARVSA